MYNKLSILCANEASHLYLYNILVNINHELSEMAQKGLKMARGMRKIVVNSIKSSIIVQWLASLALGDCARFASTKNRQ